ncbi:DUF5074 domain-containing protein [Chitinophaga vietnamensis]|uniref:DUF5074 domain-containing protein n=1 Tax=Chitinophaga vietnamensis TaxID=2593957 RepID=UPI0011778781|nr:DUF5074 domain-containing protein [Chitinophaga vietnamensis]
MRKFSRKFQFPIVLAALAVIGFSACQKNSSETVVPTIVSPGLKDGKDTIYAGDTRVLRPTLGNITTPPTFLWLVNGVPAGTDSTYTFTPTDKGDYTISFKVSSGNSLNAYYYRVKVLGRYENGFYIINEGSYPATGDVNFYRYNEDTLHLNVYSQTNPGKQLGVTTEYGAVFNNTLYVVSKQGPFIATDAFSMKETGRIAQLPADGRAFCGIDNNRGLVSTADGVYPVDLQAFTVGAKIAGITGQAGSMIKAGNYVFVLTQADGVVALNAADLSIAGKPAKAAVGFAKTTDGNIWAAAGNTLYSINSQTLAVSTVTVPFTIYDSWGFWNPGTFSASSVENAVFFAQTGQWGGGTQIYKYIPGNAASLQNAFITLPADRELYGGSVRYNPADNSLVVTGIKPGYGQNSKENTLFIYDAATGALRKSILYTGFFFPAMPAL